MTCRVYSMGLVIALVCLYMSSQYNMPPQQQEQILDALAPEPNLADAFVGIRLSIG